MSETQAVVPNRNKRELPKKLSELGRIRIGWQEPNKSGKGRHPAKLSQFRLTSSNAPLLHFAARLYGGEVHPWDDGPAPGIFELFTQANSIDVLIPTASAVSISYEIWSGGGCQRRCTGETVLLCEDATRISTPCMCPLDELVRTEQAKQGLACARILRLSVLLPDLPGMGVWRLESKGYYATAELLGTLEMLGGAGMDHRIIEAVLRLEARSDKREGKPRHYMVPVLWPKYTPRQLLAGGAHALLAPAESQPSWESQKTLQAHIDDLYGDRGADISASKPRETKAMVAPVGESLLAKSITAMMESVGMDDEGIAQTWKRWEVKYGDFSPGVLTMIHDSLKGRLVAKKSHAAAERSATDATSLWVLSAPEEAWPIVEREPGDEDTDGENA